MISSPLSYSARLMVYQRALEDEAFLERAKADPRAAILDVTGIALPDTIQVSPIFESPAEVVIWLPPEGVDVGAPANAPRPVPGAERDVYDAYLLNALARDPSLRQRIKADFNGEMGRIIGFRFIPKARVVEETATQLYLALPEAAASDELDDSLLDLVSGGSSTENCVISGGGGDVKQCTGTGSSGSGAN